MAENPHYLRSTSVRSQKLFKMATLQPQIQNHSYSFYRASLRVQLVKNLPAMQKTPVQFLCREEPLYTHSYILYSIGILQAIILQVSSRLPTPIFLGFPCGSVSKESACNAGDLGSIPGLGRSPGEGKYPFQYSGLENSIDCIAQGVAKSRT